MYEYFVLAALRSSMPNLSIRGLSNPRGRGYSNASAKTTSRLGMYSQQKQTALRDTRGIPSAEGSRSSNLQYSRGVSL